ncbi:hypothetical protein [Leptospirillum ferriphilum]|uniref:hypothetical protein n=1 Tax=Leptospirillum ferriphilum TaxID=178606 RepID=UPI001EEF8720|nr:hypothetical protein [Leptospirillum ferriphilum]
MDHESWWFGNDDQIFILIENFESDIFRLGCLRSRGRNKNPNPVSSPDLMRRGRVDIIDCNEFFFQKTLNAGTCKPKTIFGKIYIKSFGLFSPGNQKFPVRKDVAVRVFFCQIPRGHF